MPTEFQSRLEAARKPTHGGMHPFSQAWAEGRLSREQLGRWAVQHHYYIDLIPQQFAHLFARLDDLAARQFLLENLLGEEDPQGPPPRFARAFRQRLRSDDGRFAKRGSL